MVRKVGSEPRLQIVGAPTLRAILGIGCAALLVVALRPFILSIAGQDPTFEARFWGWLSLIGIGFLLCYFLMNVTLPFFPVRRRGSVLEATALRGSIQLDISSLERASAFSIPGGVVLLLIKPRAGRSLSVLRVYPFTYFPSAVTSALEPFLCTGDPRVEDRARFYLGDRLRISRRVVLFLESSIRLSLFLFAVAFAWWGYGLGWN
jgi:hypothetical protein